MTPKGRDKPNPLWSTSNRSKVTSSPPPPPPSYANPNEKRGVLLKEESRLGLKSWSKKLVVCNQYSLKYYASASPDKTEAPRKTLKINECTVEKVPVAARHFRENSFKVIHVANNSSNSEKQPPEEPYIITFSADSPEDRDEWMDFMSRIGVGRSRRLDTLIEKEISEIQEVSSRNISLASYASSSSPGARSRTSPRTCTTSCATTPMRWLASSTCSWNRPPHRPPRQRAPQGAAWRGAAWSRGRTRSSSCSMGRRMRGTWRA